MHGFIVFSLLPKYLEAFQEQVPGLVASKELIYREEVTRGLENAEAALDMFLKGAITGKGIVIVADESEAD
ncbi:hypothetical protein JVU11DRAFT_6942 [Chiua virens]|nr:hypothetical protein JVU11DRAFT_6942 [Chiua virens]